jgi:hypothetical protein
MAIHALKRQLWSSYYGLLYHAEYLPNGPEASCDFQIVLGPFTEIAGQYYSSLVRVVGKPQFTYLRYKFRGGNPHIALALVDGKVAHVSFIANTASYGEAVILDPNANGVGPCMTPASYRGRGLYPAVLKYLRGSQLGRNGLDIFCREDNISSQRGILKAGFVFQSRYHHLTRLGFTRYQITNRG